MLVGEGRRREGARCDTGRRSHFRVQDDAVQELGQSSVEEQFRRGTDALLFVLAVINIISIYKIYISKYTNKIMTTKITLTESERVSYRESLMEPAADPASVACSRTGWP